MSQWRLNENPVSIVGRSSRSSTGSPPRALPWSLPRSPSRLLVIIFFCAVIIVIIIVIVVIVGFVSRIVASVSGTGVTYQSRVTRVNILASSSNYRSNNVARAAKVPWKVLDGLLLKHNLLVWYRRST